MRQLQAANQFLAVNQLPAVRRHLKVSQYLAANAIPVTSGGAPAPEGAPAPGGEPIPGGEPAPPEGANGRCALQAAEPIPGDAPAPVTAEGQAANQFLAVNQLRRCASSCNSGRCSSSRRGRKRSAWRCTSSWKYRSGT